MISISRLCIFLFVFSSYSSVAQDCDGPIVGFGEVMAGFQAGLSGGSNSNVNSLPAGFYLSISGLDQRGFIDPERGSGWKCESDWGLVSGWFGAVLGNLGTENWGEARNIAENGIVIEFEVDGVSYDPIETDAKKGSVPVNQGTSDAMVKSWGVFLEPHLLGVGAHTATIYFFADFDCVFGDGCDGIHETSLGSSHYEFEVLAD